ncbi:MAG: M23 family metallopeptidase [Thiotrichales bacterium]|nr:M23 family metallopeptidase [Thiotrichales bacterium]
MNLILVNKSHKTWNIRLGPVLLGLSFIVFTGAAFSFFWLGSQYGSVQAVNHVSDRYAMAEDLWSQELNEQRKLIETAQDDAQKHLDSMAARLSTLQGHVMRLNALGTRLAHMAELDEIDFSIDATPGMGGPEPASMQQSLSVPDFLDAMDRLARDITDRNDKLIAIESMLIDRNLRSETVPTGRPIRDGWVSSMFGWRTNPITGRKEMHEGMDFAARYGTDIFAVAAGIVTWSGQRYGYGNMVEIDHGNGYMTRYAHNRKNLVAVGERVKKGTVIAIMGSTGRSTGSHVHFEVLKDGKFVNPRQFIATIK